MSPADLSVIFEALVASRNIVSIDRTSLVDTEVRADGFLPEDAATWVAEYDELLAKIDAAIACVPAP